MSNPAHLRLVGSRPATLRFGRFEWQPQARELLADGQPAAVRGKALDVLAVLVEHAGQLVSRQTLMAVVWADLVVEENNLSVQINALRKVLGGEVIVTVPGRGYRFTLPLEREPGVGGAGGAGLRAVAPQPAPAAVQPTLRSNLPELPAPLVGRAVDLAALGALLGQHRLVTVLGAAGMGKTRLAQAALHAGRAAYTHGVCFVDLALLAPGEAVIAPVAAALGLPQPAGADPMAGLLQALAPLQMLLALDNAEHLLPAVAALVAVLRDGAPGVHIVVTSQAPLGLSEEWVFRLGPLAVPDVGLTAATAEAALTFGAVALFALRAQARDARFAVTDANVAQVVELCARLDGAPLAIELAAARAAHLGLSALLAGLDQRLALLTGGRRDAPLRHQTLRAALQWSHDLLSPVEQAVFRRFAVFVGGASLAQVLAVVVDAGADADADAVALGEADGIARWAALDALGTLIDRSLIELLETAAPAAGGQGVEPAPRYRLLDTPRAFAREQLRAAGEEALVQQRHALAMRARYAQAREALFGGRLGFDVWRTELDLDVDNGLAAAAWAAQHDAETAWVIATGLSRNIYGRRHTDCKALWQAVEPLLDAALAALTLPSQPAPQPAPALAPAAPSPWLARALCECAVFWTNHRPVHARLRADQALPLSRAVGDTQTQCIALARIAWLCAEEETLAEFQQISAELSALCRADWPVFVQTEIHQHDWLHAHMAGDYDGALAELRLQAQRHVDCGYTDTSPYGNMVMVLMQAGRLDEAIAQSRTMLAHFVGRRYLGPSRHLLNNLACAHLAQDDTVQARAVQQALWPLAVSHDMLRHWSCNAALLAALEQRPRVALALLGYSDAAHEKAAPGRPREGAEQRMVERTLTLAQAALGGAAMADVAEFAAVEAPLRAHGAALSEAALLALALAPASEDLSAGH